MDSSPANGTPRVPTQPGSIASVATAGLRIEGRSQPHAGRDPDTARRERRDHVSAVHAAMTIPDKG